jgi:hypothetical protein
VFVRGLFIGEISNFLDVRSTYFVHAARQVFLYFTFLILVELITHLNLLCYVQLLFFFIGEHVQLLYSEIENYNDFF